MLNRYEKRISIFFKMWYAKENESKEKLHKVRLNEYGK